MEAFRWNPCFVTGLTDVDEQHHRLVDAINRFGDMVMLVFRLGGDEFLIICEATPLDGAMRLAETIRQEVALLCVPVAAGEWRGSISVGVAARTATMNVLEDRIKAADLAVYVAKRDRRNRVAVADQ